MQQQRSLTVISEGFETSDQSNVSANLPELAVREFHDALHRHPEVAVAVAAIKALTTVIQHSTAQTMHGLGKDLENAAAALQRQNPTAISLKAGCELFLRYTTRSLLELEQADIGTAKRRLIERGVKFEHLSTRARATIAELGSRFIRNGAVVLLHGYSRVALAVLQRARQQCNFSVVVTEGRPDNTGIRTSRALHDMDIPVTMVLDSGVGYCMERVDMVLLGAEAVVENGGVINKLGTFQIAVCAKAMNKPVYVAAESYKFARIYPLNQRDLPVESKPLDFGPLLPPGVSVDNPSHLGVLTPAAVSDELIQLYS
ncbi:MAG: hypothetical protein WDW36_006816 [Sanguina aurantia]